MRLRLKILIFTGAVLLVALPAICQEITVVRYTGQPMEGLVSLLLEKTGVKADIQTHPWSRIYRMALGETNILIGPFLRTKEREHLFKWLDVPIFSSKGFLYKLRTRTEVTVNNLEDAKKYKIGKSKNYALPKFLIDNGFDQTLEITISEESNFKKLLAHRIDLVVMYEKGFQARLKQIGVDEDQIVPEFLLYSLDTYMAFSRTTSDSIVKLFNAKLIELNNQGVLDRLKESDTKQ
ncbi:MAG: hypothetical protein D3926_12755 [Desulfobacteraceae bacterium]|nr:MAG: hypothetical protein D3926_12755 [Desulfobacteraceae bacterium]